SRSTCRSPAQWTPPPSRSIRSAGSSRSSAPRRRVRAIRRSSRRSWPASWAWSRATSPSWTRWTRSRACGRSPRARTPAAAAPSATAVFGFTVAKAVDAEDRVNSSNTYGFIAEVMAVEVDPDTAAITIVKYVTVHDAGTIINPMIVEGQIYGGALHGLGGALY